MKYINVPNDYDHKKMEGKGDNADYFKISVRVVTIDETGELDELAQFNINVEELPQPGDYIFDDRMFRINGYNYQLGFMAELIALEFKPLHQTKTKCLEGMVKTYQRLLKEAQSPVQTSSQAA